METIERGDKGDGSDERPIEDKPFLLFSPILKTSPNAMELDFLYSSCLSDQFGKYKKKPGVQ